VSAKKIEYATVCHFALRFGQTMRPAHWKPFRGTAAPLPHLCSQENLADIMSMSFGEFWAYTDFAFSDN
jgi:hypothetical protein